MPDAVRLYDVLGYQLGRSAPGQPPSVAVSFQLRDGSVMAFALPAEMATGLVFQITTELRALADEPERSSH